LEHEFFNKISVGLLLTLAVISSLNAKTTQSEKWLKTALDRSEYQLLAAAEKYKADKSNPRTCENGKVVLQARKTGLAVSSPVRCGICTN